MRIAALLTAVAGLAVAGGSVYLTRDLLEVRTAAPLDTAASTRAVIVASRDIQFGEPIDAQLLATIAWPVDHVPAGVFHAYDDLLEGPKGEPRRARRAISQGDPLRATTVSEFGEKVTIVQTLSPNTRAMAINVDAATSVGGFVTPGDRVDVVLTQGRNESLRAVTILQNIRVIGVDQDADELDDTPGVARTVTVEVTADQGQRLALAQRAGALSLSLRSLDDDAAQELDTVQLNDLLFDSMPVEVKDRRPVVRIRRATDLSETIVN
ncbi:Flp pilus assembly protein CpaB [Roseivivax marinus]|uniref:Flp pilus assembly protein CpaB n=1 Tax=Roseivivax marinus TaxID=1379903 RepID=UPI00273ED6F6|nr:Flp pilus assembly protein CpaB [Roseivivax marinus]